MWRLSLVTQIAFIATLFIPATLLPQHVVAQSERDEIIVTSRRKEENLQEVPLSITVIDADQIQARGIKTFDNLTGIDPSLLIDRGFTAEDTRITVRGLTNTRGRSNVAFLVDGVDVTSEATRTGGSSVLVNQRLLTDVERIEIIKGPKSALYGRAAFAGAISYVTKDANLENIDFTAGLELADYDRYQVSAGVSGPVIKDKLGVAVQAVNWDGDGFYDNAASGQDVGGSDGYGISFTTNYVASDDLSLKWRISYSEDTTGPAPQTIFRGDDFVLVNLPPQALESNGGPIDDADDPVAVVPTLGNAGNRQVFASEDPTTGAEYEGSSLDLLRTSLGIDWNVGPGVFTSTTGFTNALSQIQQDVDYQGEGRPDTIPNNFEADTRTRTRQLSQEFRYATDFDSAFNYTVGVLGWKETRDVDNRGYIVNCSSGLPPCDVANWQGLIREVDIQYGDGGFANPYTDHWSVYGLMDWEFSETVTVELEGRYSNESFELDRTVTTLCSISPPIFLQCDDVESNTISGSTRSDFFTPKLTIEYQPADATLFYASIGKAQKPAGINTLSTSINDIEQLKFDSEKMWVYEAGWKTQFDGSFGSVTFNGAIFFQDYTDKQVQVVVFDEELGLVPNIENASSAEVFGQELQLTWAPPIDGLILNLAYTHLDTEFTDYVTTSRTARTIAELGNCTAIQVPDDPDDPDSTRPECQIDYTGKELERSPDHAVYASVDFTRPLFDTGLDYLVQFDADYQSERFVNATNYTILEDRWIANLRLGVEADNWSVIAFADNVFDDDTIVSGGTATPDFGAGFSIPPVIQVSSQLPPPRVVGVRANVRFGD